MSKCKVVLIFRKPRYTGNFSMETSFERMAENFPDSSAFGLEKFVSSFYSNGLLPRLRGILEARRHHGDVNHVIGDVHYLVLGLPGKRTLLTIHDCGLMNHPNPVVRRILKWIWLDLPIRHCRFITAVSEATKQDIIRYTGCQPDKIVVIPTVIGEQFRPDERDFNEEYPRILHIGLAPNKNFERHVESLEGIRCHLHVLGKLEAYHENILKRFGISYSSEYNISDEAMQTAYAESDLLLFASTLEGFGMPIVEAQTVGRPVITSNLSSMPEVAGDGACFVDPYRIEDIRAAVTRMIQDRDFREDLLKKGSINVARFCPEAVARQYEKLYVRMVS